MSHDTDLIIQHDENIREDKRKKRKRKNKRKVLKGPLRHAVPHRAKDRTLKRLSWTRQCPYLNQHSLNIRRRQRVLRQQMPHMRLNLGKRPARMEMMNLSQKHLLKLLLDQKRRKQKEGLTEQGLTLSWPAIFLLMPEIWQKTQKKPALLPSTLHVSISSSSVASLFLYM